MTRYRCFEKAFDSAIDGHTKPRCRASAEVIRQD